MNALETERMPKQSFTGYTTQLFGDVARKCIEKTTRLVKCILHHRMDSQNDNESSREKAAAGLQVETFQMFQEFQKLEKARIVILKANLAHLKCAVVKQKQDSSWQLT